MLIIFCDSLVGWRKSILLSAHLSLQKILIFDRLPNFIHTTAYLLVISLVYERVLHSTLADRQVRNQRVRCFLCVKICRFLSTDLSSTTLHWSVYNAVINWIRLSVVNYLRDLSSSYQELLLDGSACNRSCLETLIILFCRVFVTHFTACFLTKWEIPWVYWGLKTVEILQS